MESWKVPKGLDAVLAKQHFESRRGSSCDHISRLSAEFINVTPTEALHPLCQTFVDFLYICTILIQTGFVYCFVNILTSSGFST